MNEFSCVTWVLMAGNAVGLGQFDRLPDFDIAVVAPHEGGDVAEVARVGVAADEVAAHDETADFLAPNLARGHGLSRSGRRSAAGAGVSAAELVWPPRLKGTAAEAMRDDFTKPRREICRVMGYVLSVLMGNVKDGA